MQKKESLRQRVPGTNKKGEFKVSMTEGKKTAIREATHFNAELSRLTPYFITCGISHAVIPEPITIPPQDTLVDQDCLKRFKDTIDSEYLKLRLIEVEASNKPMNSKPAVNPSLQDIFAEAVNQNIIGTKQKTPRKVTLDIELIKKTNQARKNLLAAFKERGHAAPEYLANEINIPSEPTSDADKIKINTSAQGTFIQFQLLHDQLIKKYDKPETIKASFDHFGKHPAINTSPQTKSACIESAKSINLHIDQMLHRLHLIHEPPSITPHKITIEDYKLDKENGREQFRNDLNLLILELNTLSAPFNNSSLGRLSFPLDDVKTWMREDDLQAVIQGTKHCHPDLAKMIDLQFVLQLSLKPDVKFIGERPCFSIEDGIVYIYRYYEKEKKIIKEIKEASKPVITEKKAPTTKEEEKSKRKKPFKKIEETRIPAPNVTPTSFSATSNHHETRKDYEAELKDAKLDVKISVQQIEIALAENERQVEAAYLNVDNHVHLGDKEQYIPTDAESLLTEIHRHKNEIHALDALTSTSSFLEEKLKIFNAIYINYLEKINSCSNKLAQIEMKIQNEMIEAEKAAARSRHFVNDDDDGEPSPTVELPSNDSESEEDNDSRSPTSENTQNLVALEKKSEAMNTSHHFIGMRLNNETKQKKAKSKKKSPAKNAPNRQINPLALDLYSSGIEKSLTAIDELYDKYMKHCAANNKQGVFDVASAISMIDLEGMTLNVFETILNFQKRNNISLFVNADDAANCRNVSKHCFHWFIFKAENTNNKADYNMLDLIQFVRNDVKQALSSLMYSKGEYKIKATHPQLEKIKNALIDQNAKTSDIAVLNARFSTLISFTETILKEHHKQTSDSLRKHEQMYALSFLLALIGLTIKNIIEITKENAVHYTSYPNQSDSMLAQLQKLTDETEISTLLQSLSIIHIKKLLIEICNEKSHENKNAWTKFKPLQAQLTLILTNFVLNKAEQLRPNNSPEPTNDTQDQIEAPLSFSDRATDLLSDIFKPENQYFLYRITSDPIFQSMCYALQCLHSDNLELVTDHITFVLAGNNLQEFKKTHFLDIKAQQLFNEVATLFDDVNCSMQPAYEEPAIGNVRFHF